MPLKEIALGGLTPKQLQQLITIRQFAEVIGGSISTARRLLDNDPDAPRKIYLGSSRNVRLHVDDVNQFVAKKVQG